MNLQASVQKLADRINPRFRSSWSLDAGTLKIIGILTMFIDHLTYAFLEVKNPDGLTGRRYLSAHTSLPYAFWDGTDGLGRMIGRTAFPIFLFLAVEGYLHTRNRGKYLLRLLLFAVLSQLPFQYLFYPHDGWNLNTLFTISLGLLNCLVVDVLILSGIGLGTRKSAAVPAWQWLLRIPGTILVVGGSCILSDVLKMDYAWGGILAMVCMLIFRQIRVVSLVGGYIILSIRNLNELNSAVGFILLQCYNGRRGRQMKYFFYLFYPAHLALLLFMRYIVWGY